MGNGFPISKLVHLISTRDIFLRTFQQDKAPCHTAKRVEAWFKENNVNVRQWPARSPDLNPI